MELSTITAIAAIDGRYRQQVHQLDEYFSEFGLIKYRILIEVHYLFWLEKKKILKLGPAATKHLRSLCETFSIDQAMAIKAIEKTTNHDVKAVEYFLKKELDACGASHCREWVHFGLTSQDINNTAVPLAWKHAMENEYLPALLNLNTELRILAQRYQDIPLLARTHGQPASPTKLGKEMMVFVERI
ncbi:MAG: lyase family protein, partial [Sphingomonadales bacterium]